MSNNFFLAFYRYTSPQFRLALCEAIVELKDDDQDCLCLELFLSAAGICSAAYSAKYFRKEKVK